MSSEVAKADKSLFVQELILTTLSESSHSPSPDDVLPVSDPLPKVQQQTQKQPTDRPEEENIKSKEEQVLEHECEKEEEKHEDHESPLAAEQEVAVVASDVVQATSDLENRDPDPSDECGEDVGNVSDDVIISPTSEREEEDGRVAQAIRSKVQSHPPPIALRSTVHRNVRASVVRDESSAGRQVYDSHHPQKRLPGTENRTTSVSTDDRPSNRVYESDATAAMAAAAKKSCMNRRKTSDFKQ